MVVTRAPDRVSDLEPYENEVRDQGAASRIRVDQIGVEPGGVEGIQRIEDIDVSQTEAGRQRMLRGVVGRHRRGSVESVVRGRNQDDGHAGYSSTDAIDQV